MKTKITKLTLFAFAFMLLFVGKANAQEPGQAYYFPGPTGSEGPDAIHARIDNTGAFDFASGTIEAWIRPDFDLNNQGYDNPFLFSVMDWNGKRWGIRIGKDYGGIGVVQGGDGWNTDWFAYKFEKGHWYHIAAVFNANQTVSIYINGTSKGTSAVTIDLGVTGKPFKLGISNSWDTGNIFKGAMDEVRVWSTMRTEADIKANMNTTVDPANTDLIAYYKLNNGSGTLLEDSRPTSPRHGNIGYWGSNTLQPSAPNWQESYAMVVPQLQAESGVTNTSFTANWLPPTVGTAESYVIDVATDANFNNKVAGYDGLDVGNVLTKEVTGLTPNTTYYYRLRANKTSVTNQGAYSTTSINPSNVLPLDFVSFKAVKDNNAISLNWQTANEVNTSHFNVLHSTNGTNWAVVGTVGAKGLASNSYSYKHISPTSGDNYYKLQQVDANGDFTLSEIKIVAFTLSAAVKVYPNPVAETLNIQLPNVAKAVNYSIYNTTGQKVKEGVINSGYHAVDVNALAKGVYFVKMDDEAQVKFIKQ